MAKGNVKSYVGAYLGIIAVLVILLIAFVVLYLVNVSSYNILSSQLTSNLAKVSLLKSQLASNLTALSSAENQISVLKSQLASNETLLSNAEYNLTHPYTEVLYSDKTINIPPESSTPYYNYTYGENSYMYTAGQYILSFNAPSYGYIIFNETNTGMENNLTTKYFAIYISPEAPYNSTSPAGTTSMEVSSYIAPWTQVGPANGQTVLIPVSKGTNYIIFSNFNLNTGITVTFSMTFVGYHTS